MNVVIDSWQLLKQMSRNVKFTSFTILVMTMGITSALFMLTLAHSALYSKLPFQSEQRIRIIDSAENSQQSSFNNIDYSLYKRIKERNNILEHLNAFHTSFVQVGRGKYASNYLGVYSEPKMFTLAPVEPIEGKLFSYQHVSIYEEDVVMVSETLARTYFGRTSGVVGRQIVINDRIFRVLAVLPNSYKFPHAGEIWLPLKPQYLESQLTRDSQVGVSVIGRLPLGMEEQFVSNKLEKIISQSTGAMPRHYRDIQFSLASLQRAFLGKQGVTTVHVLQVLSFVLLTLTCVNACILLFSNALKRQHEAAIRMTMGANPFRLFRQLMIESGIVSVVSVCLTIIITHMALSGLANIIPFAIDSIIPFWWQFSLNGNLLVLTIVAVAGAMLAIGSIPAWNTIRTSGFSAKNYRVFGSTTKTSHVLLLLEFALSSGLFVLGLTLLLMLEARNNFLLLG